MPSFLSDFDFERYSFWIGFLAGIIFWWFQARFRAYFSRIRKEAKEYTQTAKMGISANIEIRYRNELLKHAQQLHLASPYFSLDEIYIPQKLLAPPPLTVPGSESSEPSIVETLLPYLPDWPELASIYRAPTIPLMDALKLGANLIITGNPGSGKTVILAYFASLLARKDQKAGPYSDYLPIFIHASDLLIALRNFVEPIRILADALGVYVSSLVISRLPEVLHRYLEAGKGFLLVDGFDELSPEDSSIVAEFIGVLLQQYVSGRIIVCASSDFTDGLTDIGMIPVPMAAWDNEQRNTFLEKWDVLWRKYIEPPVEPGANGTEYLLVRHWLDDTTNLTSPFEMTLITWAAYAGDLLGPTSPNAIEAYIQRMIADIPKARPALETLAVQSLLSMNSTIPEKVAFMTLPDSSSSIAPFEEETTVFQAEDQSILAATPEEQTTLSPSPQSNLPSIPFNETQDTLPESPDETGAQQSGGTKKPVYISQSTTELVRSGLLTQRIGAHVGFCHPIIAAYLAGTSLASSGGSQNVLNQPSWIGKNLTLGYLAYWNDITPMIAKKLEAIDDPLMRDFFITCRWLRDATKSSQWHSLIMRRMAGVLSKHRLPLGLRARTLAALLLSGDPGVAVLLRQSLSNPHGSIRMVSALGCGVLKDSKAVEILVGLIDDADIRVTQASLLALVAIGNKSALDAVASTLLEGNERQRRAAAEALANHPEEGHPALEEGSTMEDLLVRRAIVFGLARVGEPWAIERLEQIQVEDSQWAVKNLAQQTLEDLHNPDPHIPTPLPPLTETPWLIAYAGKKGIGVAPGEPAEDLVIQALDSDNGQERLAALDYFRLNSSEKAIIPVLQMLYEDDDLVKEKAFNTLWYMAAMGMPIPPPEKFGLPNLFQIG